METIIFPDYTHSNLNFVASIMQHFGIETNVPALTNLPKNALQKQHLIFLLLDGFGNNLAKEFQLPFLSEHQIDTLTSVFPSTTTAAIPSLLTGKYPLEHGALGWSLYFKELVRLIAYLPASEHITEEKMQPNAYPIYDIIQFQSMFSALKKQNSDLDLHYFVPDYIAKSDFTQKMGTGAHIHGVKTIPKMLKKVRKIIKKAKKRTFFYCYFTKPDSYEHKFGVYSPEVKEFMEATDREIESFSQKVQAFDTELFITSDHGLTDIQEYIKLQDYPNIIDAMLYPLFPEGRFASFFIKPHRKEKFWSCLQQFEKDFLLFTRQEFLEKNFLGYGIQHNKIDDFIGDFIAIAIGKKAFQTSYPNQKKETLLKAHHCGLTAAEMQVPLIRIT